MATAAAAAVATQPPRQPRSAGSGRSGRSGRKIDSLLSADSLLSHVTFAQPSIELAYSDTGSTHLLIRKWGDSGTSSTTSLRHPP